ncbi:MAG: xanthine dehydrogenase family protein molybdopterin-binding subunit, partial [Xanthobacteraceae bacterium]
MLRGRGCYIDDLPTKPNTLHAAILRSPHAHAIIRGINTEAAKEIVGVHSVYTGADIAKVLDAFPSIVRSAPPYRAVTIDKVRYVGEPLAVVLAVDRYTAEDGLAAIEVDYETLPAVVSPTATVAADAPLLHEETGSNTVWSRQYRYGDPDTAFAKADKVVRVTLTFPKYNSTPLETYGVVADYLPERDSFEIHGNFQGPFSLMPVMARALRVPENRLRLILPQDIGGSFGIKAMIYPYMALMAACAKLCGRPVKWIEDRMEHLTASASGTDRDSELE